MSTFCECRWARVATVEWGSDRARGEQPRQLGVDAGEAVRGVGGGVAGDAAERRRGCEEALGVLCLGEVVAVAGDDKLEASTHPERV